MFKEDNFLKPDIPKYGQRDRQGDKQEITEEEATERINELIKANPELKEKVVDKYKGLVGEISTEMLKFIESQVELDKRIKLNPKMKDVADKCIDPCEALSEVNAQIEMDKLVSRDSTLEEIANSYSRQYRSPFYALRALKEVIAEKKKISEKMEKE